MKPERTELIDFTLERQRYRRFVGRDDVLAQLDEWLLGPGEAGWVVVTGGPGMGKSAILSAWLARREAAGAVVAHHFVRRQVASWDQPEVIAASLAGADRSDVSRVARSRGEVGGAADPTATSSAESSASGSPTTTAPSTGIGWAWRLSSRPGCVIATSPPSFAIRTRPVALAGPRRSEIELRFQSAIGAISAATWLPREWKRVGDREDEPGNCLCATLRGHCRNAR